MLWDVLGFGDLLSRFFFSGVLCFFVFFVGFVFFGFVFKRVFRWWDLWWYSALQRGFSSFEGAFEVFGGASNGDSEIYGFKTSLKEAKDKTTTWRQWLQTYGRVPFWEDYHLLKGFFRVTGGLRGFDP